MGWGLRGGNNVQEKTRKLTSVFTTTEDAELRELKSPAFGRKFFFEDVRRRTRNTSSYRAPFKIGFDLGGKGTRKIYKCEYGDVRLPPESGKSEDHKSLRLLHRKLPRDTMGTSVIK